jgi:hypothetical protein
MPAIPALGRLRQEGLKCEASLGDIINKFKDVLSYAEIHLNKMK